ncbi:MAG: aldose 1-epimerase [Sediminicola sp.]|tara:strand:+ start:176167 stop:176946 length:780 start_codon:yes stop_codon:yes gene_type:complete
MIELRFKEYVARVEAGELIGFAVSGHEFIHQKGSPGWRSSDTEMFPIIGPTNEANFRVSTTKGDAVQDQHGLLREIPYRSCSSTATKTVYKKEYFAGQPVENSKFPAKSTEQWLSWPYDFVFEKSFELAEGGLMITFTVSGDLGMPFMLGYHPAFKLYTESPTIQAGDTTISLSQVLAVGNRALYVPGTNSVTLSDKKDITVRTEGFGHFMLWTEVPNMVCMEPISFYPYNVPQNELHSGFQIMGKEPMVFKVGLFPRN